MIQILKTFFCAFASVGLAISPVWAEIVTIPANTMVYVETDQPVSGKKKHTQVGQVVRASIWRDVQVDGIVVIDAGTPVLVRVDTLKGAKIAGIKGKMTLGAYDTIGVDRTTIDLGGGYYKEGKGRIALTATLAGIVFLPLIFMKGKSANLPRGTVFDAYTKRRVTINLGDQITPSQSVNLSGIMGPSLDVEVLYDELTSTDKPKYFSFAITAPVGSAGVFVVDTVNHVRVDEIGLETELTGEIDDREHWQGTVKIKKLGKVFKKGINTFEIVTTIDGERVSKEVVLDIQI
jgi:hypothetical protein